MVVAAIEDQEREFSITVPASIRVLSKSYTFWNGSPRLEYSRECGQLSGTTGAIANGNGYDPVSNTTSPKVGLLAAGQLPLDVKTRFLISGCVGEAYVAIVLILREPPE